MVSRENDSLPIPIFHKYNLSLLNAKPFPSNSKTKQRKWIIEIYQLFTSITLQAFQ